MYVLYVRTLILRIQVWLYSDFGGLVVSVLASGTRVRGFKPGRSRRSHVVNLRHIKEPKRDVEVATFGKILGYFSNIVPPSAAGVRACRFRRGGHLVAGVGTF